MSIVTITINNKKFNLSCSEESRDRLITLSEKLDTEMKDLAAANSYASFELLLVMLSLQLMDHKQSNVMLSGGEALEAATEDFKKQFLSISSELESVLEKLKDY